MIDNSKVSRGRSTRAKRNDIARSANDDRRHGRKQDSVPKRAFGRSLSDFQTEDTPSRLHTAELQLLGAVKKGAPCVLIKDADLLATDKGELCLLPNKPPAECEKNVRVRGEFLRYLALGGDTDNPVHENGVELVGALIDGVLDLRECEVTCALDFRNCWFEKRPSLRGARLRSLSLRGSRVPGLDALEASFAGTVYMIEGFRSDGIVWLQQADIGGSLFCFGGRFLSGPAGGNAVAIAGGSIKIRGHVDFRAGFRAEGQIHLLGADIGGDLNCEGGSVVNRNPDGTVDALVLQGAKIRGNVLLRNKFRAEGQVSLSSTEIGGDLDCEGGSFVNRNPDGTANALVLQGAKIRGNVLLRDTFRAEGKVGVHEKTRMEGQVWLRGTEIGGDLDCSGGEFVNRRGGGNIKALYAHGANVKGNFILKKARVFGECCVEGAEIGGHVDCLDSRLMNRMVNGVTYAFNAIHTKIKGNALLGGRIRGIASFSAAEIGGSLECYGLFSNRIKDGSGVAISGEGAEINGSVLLRHNLSVAGRVNLAHTRIEGDLDCEKGCFVNSTKDGEGIALDVLQAEVKSSVLLGSGFQAEGRVDFLGARIGAQMSCAGGHFINASPEKVQPKQHDGAPIASVALQLQEIKINDTLFLGPPANSPDEQVVIQGSISLFGAYARNYTDDPKSWPPEYVTGPDGKKYLCCIDLDGFTFDRLGGFARPDANVRKLWLRRQPPDDSGSRFRQQPFANLIKVFRAMGHDEDARAVAEDKQESRRQEWNKKATWLKWFMLSPFWWLFGRLVGHGYRPERLFWLLIALWFGCALFYIQADLQGGMAPTSPSIILNKDLIDCHPPQRWTDCGAFTKHAPEYAKFNAFVYSADLMLPVLDLQQKRAWAPIWLLPWLFVWFQTVAGWIGSLVLIGVATSYLVRRD